RTSHIETAHFRSLRSRAAPAIGLGRSYSEQKRFGADPNRALRLPHAAAYRRLPVAHLVTMQPNAAMDICPRLADTLQDGETGTPLWPHAVGDHRQSGACVWSC